MMQAQLVLSTTDLSADISFFEDIGFRLEQIYPADHPQVAVISGHGMQIKLDRSAESAPVTLNLLSEDHENKANSTAPNGTVIQYQPLNYKMEIPPTLHKFEVRRLKDKEPWVIGRAGMLYRDLIPDRLGGSIIASHIRIPKGGPVPDMVHYHTIGFQLIYCLNGWVKLVYEDQGPPFILKAGDCVTQPPEIRHRVLESSDQLEVLEIGVPASHMTTIDHDMELPTNTYRPDREFQGQLFCHHQLSDAVWEPWTQNGFEFRDTGVQKASKQVASVHVVRCSDSNQKEKKETKHKDDILFTFIAKGKLGLVVENQENHILEEGEAFVIPPGILYHHTPLSSDTELIEVRLR